MADPGLGLDDQQVGVPAAGNAHPDAQIAGHAPGLHQVLFQPGAGRTAQDPGQRPQGRTVRVVHGRHPPAEEDPGIPGGAHQQPPAAGRFQGVHGLPGLVALGPLPVGFSAGRTRQGPEQAVQPRQQLRALHVPHQHQAKVFRDHGPAGVGLQVLPAERLHLGDVELRRQGIGPARHGRGQQHGERGGHGRRLGFDLLDQPVPLQGEAAHGQVPQPFGLHPQPGNQARGGQIQAVAQIVRGHR